MGRPRLSIDNAVGCARWVKRKEKVQVSSGTRRGEGEERQTRKRPPPVHASPHVKTPEQLINIDCRCRTSLFREHLIVGPRHMDILYVSYVGHTITVTVQ
jgi:hypothetical protein